MIRKRQDPRLVQEVGDLNSEITSQQSATLTGIDFNTLYPPLQKSNLTLVPVTFVATLPKSAVPSTGLHKPSPCKPELD